MILTAEQRLDRIRGRVMIAREFVEAGRSQTAILRALGMVLQELEHAGCGSSAVERFRDGIDWSEHASAIG